MDEYLGVIKLYAGQYPPQGYMECKGQRISKHQEETLYSLLGNMYGGEESDPYFMLPNLTPPNENMMYIICIRGIYPSRY